MNDQELDALIANANPFLGVDDAQAALNERPGLPSAIRAAETEVRPRPFPARRRVLAAAGMVAAALAIAAVAIAPSPLSRGNDSPWAAEAVAVARSAPRILVGADGWHVTRADEFSDEIGELTFSNGERELDVHWRPADTHNQYVEDRRVEAEPNPLSLRVLGHSAIVFQYRGNNDFTTLWLDGSHSVEVRGDFDSRDEYLTILRLLRGVSVDEWLSAMPASVVRPVDRAEAVAGMLADIPLPPGFDVEALKRGESISDRYQLGARVVKAVSCSWVARWQAARASGDTAVASESVAAMATSRNWAILLEMTPKGDYPEAVWRMAGLMAGSANPQFGPDFHCD